MGAALRDAHEGLRSLSPRERAGGARDRLRGPPVPGTPAAARRAVAWGLQTCLVFLRVIHAHVTVNSWQSRVPCVPVWGRRNGADPKARGSVVVPSYPIAPSCTPPGACRVIHPAGGMARRAAGRQDRDRGGEPVERAVHY